jgi:uncharacterized protein YndB with AHSA1/START domain
MSTESIEVSGVIHAPPDRIYQAWLDSSEHTAMTGGRATVDPSPGGRFTAWDGYIEGSTVELDPGRRILQRWRTTEFPADAADSRLEVRLEPLENGTRVAFLHSEIPEGQATRCEQGWREHYLEPMSRYFASGSEEPEGEAARMPEEAEPAFEAPSIQPTPKPPMKKASAPKPAAKKAAAKKAAPKRAAKKAGARKKTAKKAKKAPRRAARKPAKKASRKGKSRSARRSARRSRR